MGAACSQGAAPYHPRLAGAAADAASNPVLPDEPHKAAGVRRKIASHQGQEGARRKVSTRSVSIRSSARRHAGSVGDSYEMSRKIGAGTYGSVFVGTHCATGAVRALKTVRKQGAQRQQALEREVAMMQAMDHPNIIKLFETVEDAHHIHFAMELCRGGELYERILEAGQLSESNAALVLRQILQAVVYMHSSGIAHRDLKPENFLFVSEGPVEGNTLKLIDFGLACPCHPGQMLRSKVGTPSYMAPQVLMGRYDTQCDSWSVGVIMYVLLSGRHPFHGATDQETMQKVRAGFWRFVGDAWERVGDEAKVLLKALLRRSPEARYTAEQALNDDWIRQHSPRGSPVKLDAGVLERVCSLEPRNRLQTAALEIIAGQLQENETNKRLREAFLALDANGDGRLSAAELAEGLELAGVVASRVEVETIVARVDGTGSGAMCYTEFLAAALDRRTDLTDDALRVAFDVFDRDGDGWLLPEELRRALRAGATGPRRVRAASVEKVLQELGAGQDDAVSFGDFAEMMRGTSDGTPDFKCAIQGSFAVRSLRPAQGGA